jgi:NAD(P)-dependent dehydrogenase (short-subunit alcohol dehydrogenase family)
MTPRTFSATSTTDEVLEGIDLSGRVAVVTGASAGLGVETSRALAAHGAHVVLAARDLGKAQRVADELALGTGSRALEVMELHLDRPASVRAFAKALLAEHPAVSLLLGNAGVMACPLLRTAEGWEMQMATNHYGHFLLACLLAPALRAGAPSRAVFTSSAGHRFSPVVFEDVHFERRPYDKWAAYGQSKSANVLCAVELDRRLAAAGVHAFGLHPGGIMTELGRHLGAEDIAFIQSRQADREKGGMPKFKTVEQGAATQVWAATAPELAGRGGLYLEDCQVSGTTPPPGSVGCEAWALDPVQAARLWEHSEATLGEAFALA